MDDRVDRRKCDSGVDTWFVIPVPFKKEPLVVWNGARWVVVRRSRRVRVAHASRVLVAASRRNELRSVDAPTSSPQATRRRGRFGRTRRRKFASAGRRRQHAGRVRYPELRIDALKDLQTAIPKASFSTRPGISARLFLRLPRSIARYCPGTGSPSSFAIASWAACCSVLHGPVSPTNQCFALAAWPIFVLEHRLSMIWK